MKNCKAAQMYTSTGYPFTVYGKRGHSWTLIEWEWDDCWVRIPLNQVTKNPDVALSVAASKVLRGRQ